MKPILMAATACLLTGCLADDAEQIPTTLANPSATYCTENGGTYESREAKSGDFTGVCILADGREVDAWDHLRANS